jgi:hypothetical protein
MDKHILDSAFVAPFSIGRAECVICGKLMDANTTLSEIRIDDKLWFVCDTDKCKREVLKQLIIQLM